MNRESNLVISENEEFVKKIITILDGPDVYRTGYDLGNYAKDPGVLHVYGMIILDYASDDPRIREAYQHVVFQSFIIPAIILVNSAISVPGPDRVSLIHITLDENFPLLFSRFHRYLSSNRDSIDKFNVLFEASPDVILLVDIDTKKIIRVNYIVFHILGYHPEELAGSDYFDLLPKIQTDDGFEDTGRFYGSVVESPGLLRKDGSICPMDVTWSMIDWEGRTVILSTFRDISERKEAEKTIAHMAFHDSLTGLPNRLHLLDVLDKTMNVTDIPQVSFAILFLDLDRFKTINDSLGHDTGDELLKAVSERLKSTIRSEDVVCRLGGDEFVVLLHGVDSEEQARYVASKVLRNMAHPYYIGVAELYITVSIGISLIPQDGNEIENALRNADLAMYLAKDMGRNNYQFYTDELNRRAQSRLEMEHDLRRAIDNREFVLYYQPVVDPRTEKVMSVEALIRWNHPTRGLRYPASFIPLAEEIGLIDRIGIWVLGEACRQNREWQKYPELDSIAVAVNISGKHFQEDNFVDHVRAALKESELDGSHLVLELTESILVEDMDITIEKLKTLQRMGISISIDDFGTGYSSLNYIQKFPLNILKIDRSFVQEINQSGEGSSIIHAIVTMAHNMGLNVVAEGIENIEQLHYLDSLDCNRIQGFYYYKPSLPDEIHELLKR